MKNKPVSQKVKKSTRTQPAGQEIPRGQWVKFFDDFSRQHDGWLAEVKVREPGARSQVEARRLPLQGITVDLNPLDHDTTSIILDMQPNVHLTHIVTETKKVVLKEKQQELVIDSAQGNTTVLHFHTPAKIIAQRLR